MVIYQESPTSFSSGIFDEALREFPKLEGSLRNVDPSSVQRGRCHGRLPARPRVPRKRRARRRRFRMRRPRYRGRVRAEFSPSFGARRWTGGWGFSEIPIGSPVACQAAACHVLDALAARSLRPAEKARSARIGKGSCSVLKVVVGPWRRNFSLVYRGDRCTFGLEDDHRIRVYFLESQEKRKDELWKWSKTA